MKNFYDGYIKKDITGNEFNKIKEDIEIEMRKSCI